MRKIMCKLDLKARENRYFLLQKKFFDLLGNKTVLRKVSHD